VSVSITDDGKSFDVQKAWACRKGQRLGLLGMRERVEMVRGTFLIESTPGHGTTIRIKIPFKDNTSEPANS
jgi:signal transduction histidine kinase